MFFMLERRKILLPTNFNILKFSDFIDQKILKRREVLEKTDYDKIRHFKIDDISIGEHAYAGALRYMLVEPDYSDDDVLIKKIFFSALKTYFVSKNLFMSQNFNLLVLNHGIIKQGIISEVVKKRFESCYVVFI